MSDDGLDAVRGLEIPELEESVERGGEEVSRVRRGGGVREEVERSDGRAVRVKSGDEAKKGRKGQLFVESSELPSAEQSSKNRN